MKKNAPGMSGGAAIRLAPGYPMRGNDRIPHPRQRLDSR